MVRAVVNDASVVGQRLPYLWHGWFPSLESQPVHNHFRQPLFFQPIWDRVNVTQGRKVDDRIARNTAVQTDLVFEV